MLSIAAALNPEAIYDDAGLYLACGLAPATLRRGRRSGRLRSTRPGNRTLYLGRWVLEWLEAESRKDGCNGD